MKEEELFDGKTISIVCNGASLLEKDYSIEIDNSDLVVRFNHGALFYQNFPTLGKRMDIFAVNSYDGEDHESILKFLKTLKPEVHILSTRPFEQGLKFGLYTRNVFLRTYSEIENIVFEIKKETFLSNSVNNYYNFTSGASTVLYLQQFNVKEVKVFGYDSYNDEKDYFYIDTKVKNLSHDTEIENKIIQDLDKVTFFT